MTPMTQKEKAEAYDKAVREASIAYKDEDRHLKATLERIFPELKESESYDEKIRKDIIKFLIDVNNGFYTKSELKIASWIAWLEKQGEQKPYSQMEKCINCQFNYTGYCNGTCILENKEQKPTDKVEPKFKVGDWIINKSHDICLITDIDLENGYYICESNRFGNTDGDIDLTDKAFHLWDIAKDAKSGDVLASKDKLNILIFRNLDTSTSFSSYYNIAGKGELGWSNECFIPATKEQRDLLLQKMHEAGYKWDFDKKELKNLT